MNHFIETLTLIKKESTPDAFEKSIINYTAPNGKNYTGRLTNEGPSKYFIEKLASEGNYFDRMVILATKKCMENKIEAVGTTSFEYYKKVMAQFCTEICEKYPSFEGMIKDQYHGDCFEYLNSIIKPVVIPNNPGKKDAQAIINAIISDDETMDESTNIYLDFTGGSRVASFISILLIRILQACNATVKNVVYANIQEEKEIVDLTENYNLLTTLERIAVAKDKGKTTDVLKQLSEIIPTISDKDMSVAKKLEDTQNQESQNLKKGTDDETTKKVEEIDSAVNEQKGVAGSFLKMGGKKAKEQILSSPFEKLKDMSTNDLILNFYEEIINILYDKGYIIGTQADFSPEKIREEIKNSISANDKYYSKINKKGEEIGGVIFRTLDWLKSLKDNSYFKPDKTFEIKTSILNGHKYGRTENSKYVCGVNKQMNNEFMEYLKENSIQIQKEISEDMIREFLRLQTIYFNYGFPFACIHNNVTYNDIKDYYFQKVKEFMMSLSELKSKDSKAYYNRLNELISNRSLLEKEIPYMVEMPSIWVFNQSKFEREGIDKDSFIKNLCERLEKVRPYRNAIAHKLKNKFSEFSEKEQLSKEILLWIEEYEKECS